MIRLYWSVCPVALSIDFLPNLAHFILGLGVAYFGDGQYTKTLAPFLFMDKNEAMAGRLGLDIGPLFFFRIGKGPYPE